MSARRSIGVFVLALAITGWNCGNVGPVVRDLDLLRHSSVNFHINAGQAWWSGFSHYTSLIFDVPYLNIAPVKPPKRRPWWRFGY